MALVVRPHLAGVHAALVELPAAEPRRHEVGPELLGQLVVLERVAATNRGSPSSYPNMAPCPAGYQLDPATEGKYCIPL